jgi:hypothetical protein
MTKEKNEFKPKGNKSIKLLKIKVPIKIFFATSMELKFLPSMVSNSSTFNSESLIHQ